MSEQRGLHQFLDPEALIFKIRRQLLPTSPRVSPFALRRPARSKIASDPTITAHLTAPPPRWPNCEFANQLLIGLPAGEVV